MQNRQEVFVPFCCNIFGPPRPTLQVLGHFQLQATGCFYLQAMEGHLACCVLLGSAMPLLVKKGVKASFQPQPEDGLPECQKPYAEECFLALSKLQSDKDDEGEDISPEQQHQVQCTLFVQYCVLAFSEPDLPGKADNGFPAFIDVLLAAGAVDQILPCFQHGPAVVPACAALAWLARTPSGLAAVRGRGCACVLGALAEPAALPDACRVLALFAESGAEDLVARSTVTAVVEALRSAELEAHGQFWACHLLCKLATCEAGRMALHPAVPVLLKALDDHKECPDGAESEQVLAEACGVLAAVATCPAGYKVSARHCSD